MLDASSLGSNNSYAAATVGTNDERAMSLARHPAYIDYANQDDAAVLQQLVSSNEDLQRRLCIGQRELFPVKLHAALEACSATPHLSHIIRWLPHGRAFKVYDKPRFVDEVLPYYFHGQSAYGSFQRQLNMYGFLKLTGTDHFGAYYHPLLLRGRSSLSRLLIRPDEGSEIAAANRRRMDPDSEPDFYSFSPIDTKAISDGDLDVSDAAMQLELPNMPLSPIDMRTTRRIPSNHASEATNPLAWSMSRTNSLAIDHDGSSNNTDGHMPCGSSKLVSSRRTRSPPHYTGATHGRTMQPPWSDKGSNAAMVGNEMKSSSYDINDGSDNDDNGDNVQVDNMGIRMSLEDAVAPCDRDVYAALFATATGASGANGNDMAIEDDANPWYYSDNDKR